MAARGAAGVGLERRATLGETTSPLTTAQQIEYATVPEGERYKIAGAKVSRYLEELNSERLTGALRLVDSLFVPLSSASAAIPARAPGLRTTRSEARLHAQFRASAHEAATHFHTVLTLDGVDPASTAVATATARSISARGGPITDSPPEPRRSIGVGAGAAAGAATELSPGEKLARLTDHQSEAFLVGAEVELTECSAPNLYTLLLKYALKLGGINNHDAAVQKAQRQDRIYFYHTGKHLAEFYKDIQQKAAAILLSKYGHFSAEQQASFKNLMAVAALAAIFHDAFFRGVRVTDEITSAKVLARLILDMLGNPQHSEDASQKTAAEDLYHMIYALVVGGTLPKIIPTVEDSATHELSVLAVHRLVPEDAYDDVVGALTWGNRDAATYAAAPVPVNPKLDRVIRGVYRVVMGAEMPADFNLAELPLEVKTALERGNAHRAMVSIIDIPDYVTRPAVTAGSFQAAFLDVLAALPQCDVFRLREPMLWSGERLALFETAVAPVPLDTELAASAIPVRLRTAHQRMLTMARAAVDETFGTTKTEAEKAEYAKVLLGMLGQNIRMILEQTAYNPAQNLTAAEIDACCRYMAVGEAIALGGDTTIPGTVGPLSLKLFERFLGEANFAPILGDGARLAEHIPMTTPIEADAHKKFMTALAALRTDAAAQDILQCALLYAGAQDGAALEARIGSPGFDGHAMLNASFAHSAWTADQVVAAGLVRTRVSLVAEPAAAASGSAAGSASTNHCARFCAWLQSWSGGSGRTPASALVMYPQSGAAAAAAARYTSAAGGAGVDPTVETR